MRNLQYLESQYLSQLKSRVINKFYDLFEEEQTDKLEKQDLRAYCFALSLRYVRSDILRC